MEKFFNMLPKMTNNHVHIFALIPIVKLLDIIRKNDPKLFNMIYFYDNPENTGQYGLSIFNENATGVTFNNVTKFEDWKKFSTTYDTIKKDLIVTEKTSNPTEKFERIQKLTRFIIRHYKIYYYLWYLSLYQNFKNKIFYLNVRGKPGTISKDVRFGDRCYMESHNILTIDNFINKFNGLCKEDKDICSSNFTYAYGVYKKIKCESDIIMRAVMDFNNTDILDIPKEVTEDHIFKKLIVNFDLQYDGIKIPQMMVQYIITLSKGPKNVTINFKEYLISAKIMIYTAIIINQQYDYQFFNGIDLVGIEELSHDFADFIPILTKLSYFKRYGLFIIPHYGETKIPRELMSYSDNYIFDSKIMRIGHGMGLITCKEFFNKINESNKVIYIESCPISNFVLGYYSPKKHPHRLVIDNPHLKIMICSDDNGLFGYSTVSNDYYFIYKYWKLNIHQFKKIIINGIECINYKYRNYYINLFNNLWTKLSVESTWEKLIQS